MYKKLKNNAVCRRCQSSQHSSRQCRALIRQKIKIVALRILAGTSSFIYVCAHLNRYIWVEIRCEHNLTLQYCSAGPLV